MALPPGFLDELRARVPISQVVGRRVTWHARKSNPARGDLWACCPFHEEKSPSFHVDDRKGFYKCFGCGASGDAVSFLRERDGMSFIEAVGELARMAGLPMPEENPQAAARAEKAQALADWMEAAAKFYRTQLSGARAQAARAYLVGRGLAPETLARFEIGYAPAERRALHDHLTGRGAPVAALAEAGLVGLPEGGGAPYDRFRDRIMFPIRDARGRCIAFGGRAIQPGQEPKYLNSPETPLFDKSRSLYNIGPAREAAGRAKALVAVEGYMDVIGLTQAGIAHAVAPLGTAVTETQLEMMWRVCPEPILAMDGDAAGLRAAQRVVDLALPLIAPGRSLRFALLPAGQDPDDLARSGGAAAVQAVLDAAEPLVALLWRRETEGRAFDTPERRAALDAALRTALARIPDEGLRGHYRQALAERRAALFRPADRPRPRRGGGRSDPERAAPAGPTRRSALAQARDPLAECRGREAVIVMALLHHPALLDAHADAVAAAEFAHADLDALRCALLSAHAEMVDGQHDHARFEERVAALCRGDVVTRLKVDRVVQASRWLLPEATRADAEAGLLEALSRNDPRSVLQTETEAAIADVVGHVDEDRAYDRRRLLAEHIWRENATRLPADETDSAYDSERIQDVLRGIRPKGRSKPQG